MLILIILRKVILIIIRMVILILIILKKVILVILKKVTPWVRTLMTWSRISMWRRKCHTGRSSVMWDLTPLTVISRRK